MSESAVTADIQYLTLGYALEEDAMGMLIAAGPYYLFFGVVLRYGKYLCEAEQMQSIESLPESV